MRTAHYLKANRKVELPENMVFVDTETRSVRQDGNIQIHKLWFGYACGIRLRTDRGRDYYREDWFRFEAYQDFWEWLESRLRDRIKLWVFAHNWNFDAGILNVSSIVRDRGWTLTMYINEKPPFILDFRRGTQTIRLIDTLNYFAGSLAEIGESIGVGKLVMPEAGAPQKEWDTYGKQDVEVIKTAVLGFRELVKTYELGNFQATLASQSFNAYRHKYMDTQILIHSEVAISKLERRGYYGGRTECFYLGTVSEPTYYLDVNSMYPSIMRDSELPTKLKFAVYQPTLDRVRELLGDSCLVAECEIETDEPVYPTRYNHRLVFPVGKFTTVLNTPEIEYALERGHLKAVNVMSVYTKERLFRRFVDDLYALRLKYREEGNPTYTYMVKILMNSLYGKFGQNGSKWYDLGQCDEPFLGIQFNENPETGLIQKLRCRLGMLQEFRREGESENSFPAISAHITAHGRLMLWKLIKKAGFHECYYTDTDSLFVSDRGFSALEGELSESTLGSLKLENVGDELIIYGPKDYTFRGIHKAKGIKKSARQIADDRWEQEKFHSWDFIISQGMDGEIPIETIQKTLHRVYMKGIPTDSGWVDPFTFGES